MLTKNGLEWFLRILTVAAFAAHSFFLLQSKPAWLAWLVALGFTPAAADTFLFAIIVVEIAFVLALLILPLRIICLAAALWAAIMLAVRPVPFTGRPILLEFIEHSGYWAAPLVLLALRGWPSSKKELLE
ncbi:MAG: hypothetical protein Q8R35_03620 [bacterium]|nr:hypothetical protein [bacterium]